MQSLGSAYEAHWQKAFVHGVANTWDKLAGRSAGANKLSGERRKKIKGMATPQKVDFQAS